MRTLVAALAAFMLLAAPAMAAAPTANFTVDPDPPVAGSPAEFRSVSTADPGRSIEQVQWDFDNDGTFDQTVTMPSDVTAPVTHTYASAGTWSVRVRVEDDSLLGESDEIIRLIQVAPPNVAPVAQFSISPSGPLINELVTFESFSYDYEDDPLTLAWDLDNDGVFDDGAGQTATTTFNAAGPKTVRLRVSDSVNPAQTATRSVTVGTPTSPPNEPPVAQFSISPLQPLIGQLVTFESFSYDPGGDPLTLAWDLDNDGVFEDGAGQTATTMFITAGAKTVRLRVSDSVNPAQTATRSFTVVEPAPVQPSAPAVTAPATTAPATTAPATTAPATTPPPQPSLMSPFPVVRLAGTVMPRGARVSVLEVRAPRGATVTVRCAGKKCPLARVRKTVGEKLIVRFPALHRFLPAGTVITIAVRKGDLVGKHTRFLIRADRRPKRTDACVFPGKSKPAPCPSN